MPIAQTTMMRGFRIAFRKIAAWPRKPLALMFCATSAASLPTPCQAK